MKPTTHTAPCIDETTPLLDGFPTQAHSIGDHLSARNSSAKEEKEKAAHRVANFERFGRFSTQRVLNYGEHLKLHLQIFCISAILAL